MKKFMKIFSVILIALILSSIITTTAVYGVQTIISPNDYDPQKSPSQVPEPLINKFGIIANALQVIGIVIAVIVIALLGIKYMIGSVEERADYKKTFIPYIVGALLISGTATIAKIANDIAQQI